MPDQVEAYLRSLNTSDRARAAAWDAVYSVKDDAQAQQLIQSLPFSDDVRATLWDARKGQQPQIARPAETAAAEAQPSAASRFFSNAGEMLNPVTAAKGIYQAVRHPLDTAGAIYDMQAEQFGKASGAFQQGRYSEMLGHGMAGVLPLVGPAAASAGEQIASGDVAGGMGRSAGLLAPAVGMGVAKGVVKRQARKGAPAVLEREAAQQVSQRVLAPGNVAFKGKAEAIAPEVLRRGMKGGREELAQAADEGMAEAGSRIDDAINAAGGPSAGVIVNPIVAQLERKINSMLINGEPIQGTEGRIAGLRARIAQLERTAQTQPASTVRPPAAPIRVTSFDDLRKFRDEQYRLADEAKAYRRMGNPQLSDEGFAAAESGSAVRSQFATQSPELAAANADYAFFKTLGDVLDPAQGRPKVTAPSQGITGGATTSGAVAGHLIGPKAAFVMSVVRPWIQRVRTEPAWQLADAHTKMRLAEAIRNGDVPTAQKLMVRISEGGVASATSPTESRRRTTAPAYSAP